MGLKSWTYRTQLTRQSTTEGCKVVLAFDGLDTFAHVMLDGKTILQSDNMFLPYRVDITEAIQSKSHHDLEVEFDSAFLKGQEIRSQYPDHKYICFNGDSGRLAVRKAQYHWGWDWGPVLMCAGIWRPVRLEVYSVRIADLRTDITIQDDYKQATVQASAQLEGFETQSDHIQAKVTVSLGDKAISSSQAVVTPHGKATAKLEIPQPELWWPNGYGDQPLYTVSLTISVGDTAFHTESRRIGMRRVQLIQESDRHGKSFYFRINGVDIFCGGSCWIPTDSFLTNVTPDRYRAWIQLMVPANQKMIR